MRELVRSALPRDWEVDGERVLINPPTVRDALEVLATHEGYRKGDDADTDVFTDAVRRWLPSEVAQSLANADRATVATLVLGLVLEGVEQPSGTPASENGEKKHRKMKRPFTNMLGSYCRVYRLDPWVVYTTTPWPFFLAFLTESTRQSAIEELANMRNALTPNMKGDAIKKMGYGLEKQLGFEELTDAERELSLVKSSKEGIEILQAMKEEQDAQFRPN